MALGYGIIEKLCKRNVESSKDFKDSRDVELIMFKNIQRLLQSRVKYVQNYLIIQSLPWSYRWLIKPTKVQWKMKSMFYSRISAPSINHTHIIFFLLEICLFKNQPKKLSGDENIDLWKTVKALNHTLMCI